MTAPPEITLQNMPVRSDGGSHEGRLVLVDGELVAVFAQVPAEEEAGGGNRAGWFLEAGFGPCGSLVTTRPSVFGHLDEAVEWVRARLDAGISSTP